MHTELAGALQSLSMIRPATVLGRIPMGRLGMTGEVGAAVVFWSSELPAYITGAVLPVDGGWLAFGGASPAAAKAS